MYSNGRGAGESTRFVRLKNPRRSRITQTVGLGDRFGHRQLKSRPKHVAKRQL